MPKSIWALFRVATVVTQLRNWAQMAVSLPILLTLKLASQFFGRCRFLRIGNFHLMLPKSIWAFFRVSTVVPQLQNWAKMTVSWPILKLVSQFFGRCRFLRIENFHLMLPKSIWAFFRVPTVVTQLQNWAYFSYFLTFKPILRKMAFYKFPELYFSDPSKTGCLFGYGHLYSIFIPNPTFAHWTLWALFNSQA